MDLIHHKFFDSDRDFINHVHAKFNSTSKHSNFESCTMLSFCMAKDYANPEEKLVINSRDGEPPEFFGAQSTFRSY